MVRTMRVSDDEDGPEMVLRLTHIPLPLAFPKAFLSAESLNETPDHTRTAFVSKRFERRRAALKPAQKRQIEGIHLGFQRLHLATERLKQRGLSSTEASRVHQSGAPGRGRRPRRGADHSTLAHS